MEFLYRVTESGIRDSIMDEVNGLEDIGQISFPDSDARTEFVEDCVSLVVGNYELYDDGTQIYEPDYPAIVWDTAKIYRYLNN